jgi:putative serine protease PepD
VTQVRSGTPAAQGGLKTGDVITAIGNRKIATADDLRSAVAANRPGATVTVTYKRGGTTKTASIKLANRPS